MSFPIKINRHTIWPRGRRGRQRGVALIIVVWAMALLTIFASNFTVAGRTDAKLVSNQVESAKARAMADGGIYRAIAGLSEPTLETAWGPREEPYTLRLQDGATRIWIEHEGGKIDLNQGSEELLRALFQSLDIDRSKSVELVDAIADFRDPDDLTRLYGVEDNDYEQAGLAHGAKDAPFEAVEELQQVLGMTLARFDRVAPYVTVHSGQAQIDAVTASERLLRLVPGMEAGEIEGLLAQREAAQPGTQSELTLDADASAEFLTAAALPVYTIRAEARTAGGAVFVREAIVELTQDDTLPFIFRGWKQGLRQPPEDEEE